MFRLQAVAAVILMLAGGVLLGRTIAEPHPDRLPPTNHVVTFPQ
jgi:hypothetical protein